MKVIKVSQPANWENKINLSSPKEEGVWGNYRFILTGENIDCDYWIILGDLQGIESANCIEENVIYFTDEAYEEMTYPYDFIKQFSTVVTSRNDVKHDHIIYTPYLCGWYLKKNFDFLNSLKIDQVNKSQMLSTVCSNQVALPGHKRRFSFINKMIGHFKNDLKVFGRGFNQIDDKYDALINFKYSIAIENSSIERYFSEKLTDCFLTYTMPIYYGCPNITEYFPQESMIAININNYLEAIDIIEEALRNNRYARNVDSLVEARNIYMKKFHPLQAMTDIIENNFPLSTKQKRNISLKSKRSLELTSSSSDSVFQKLLKKAYQKFYN